MAGLSVQRQNPALVLLACSAIVLLVVLASVLRTGKPGANTGGRAPLLRLRGADCAPAAPAPAAAAKEDAFTVSARANITKARDTLLTNLLPGLELPLNTTFPATGLTMQDWELFGPVINCPPGRPLTRYGGRGDGGKLLCKLDDDIMQKEDCVIYSLGSQGNYRFELDVLNKTRCMVHTFDCTYNGSSQHERHVYHKWCIGAVPDKPDYRSWANITASLGHTKVDLLKMDIECYEYPVLGEFHSHDVLPIELSMEIHIRVTPWPACSKQTPHNAVGLGLVWMHLMSLGYGVYSQEVNGIVPDRGCEFTLMRVLPASLA